MHSCPACRAELPDAASRCPRCGRPASTGETSRATSAAPAPNEIDSLLESLLEPWQPPPAREAAEPEPAATDLEAPTARRRLDEEVKEDLTDFTLRLVQAVTKSSYYTADHQEASRAKQGLYESFTKLLRDRPEVTFHMRTAGEKRLMLVYGVFDELTDLADVMRKDMSEMYTPRLAHYFEGNSLASISFKHALTEPHFHGFVDLLAARASIGAGAGEEFVAKLAAEGIQDISVVFREDEVEGRHLGWRVQMALTRLKKDLSVIPLYQNLSEDELERIRFQVFGDVIRPLRQVDLIRELLENCDLLAGDGDTPSEARLTELEGHVLAAVAEQLLPDLLRGLADDTVEARRTGGARLPQLLRLIKRVSERLEPEQARELQDAFGLLLATGAVTPEDLPVFIQERLVIERKANIFLEIADEHLRRFDRVSDPEQYGKHLRFFETILDEILSRRDPSSSLEILERVSAHRDAPAPFEGRAETAQHWLERLAHSSLGAELHRKLTEADSVKRGFLLEVLRLLGDATVPMVLSALLASGDLPAREAFRDFLEKRRGPTLRFLTQELEQTDRPVETIRELIGLLGRVGEPHSAGIAALFLEHPHPALRMEALATACALDESWADAWLVRALSDSEVEIREAARQKLFQRRSEAPAVFEHCARLLRALDETDEELACRICTDLAVYDEGEVRRRSIALLRSVLEHGEAAKGGLRSALGRLAGGEAPHAPVKIAACRALARLRAREAADTLTRLARTRSGPLKQAATQALKRVK